MANTQAIGREGETRSVDPVLLELEKELGDGPQFQLPGLLCAPVLPSCEDDARALRVLMAMLWISKDTLRSGGAVRFRVPLYDLRFASGYGSLRSNVQIRTTLDKLSAATLELVAGDQVGIFESMSFNPASDKEIASAEWVFTDDFIAMFVDPSRFALVSIRELVRLKKGVDLLLYRQAKLVKNMRRPEFVLSCDELRSACSSEEIPVKRLSQVVRRSLARVEGACGLHIEVQPVRERGSPWVTAMRFRVSQRDGKQAA